MSKLEDALREALRREDPPEGFAARVIAKLPGSGRQEAVRGRPAIGRRWFEIPRLRWAVAFAGLVLVVGGIEYRNQRLERMEGERAKEQVMLALRITGSKLRMIEARVQRLNRPGDAGHVSQ